MKATLTLSILLAASTFGFSQSLRTMQTRMLVPSTNVSSETIERSQKESAEMDNVEIDMLFDKMAELEFMIFKSEELEQQNAKHMASTEVTYF